MRGRLLVHLNPIIGVREQKCLTYHKIKDEAIESPFRNVKSIDGYVLVNFEVASLSSFRDIQKKIIS